MLITILEDDEALQYALGQHFTKAKHEVRSFTNLKDAMANDIEAGIYLVDVNLPDGLGFEYGKKVAQNNNAYLIYLTVRQDQSDIIEGFSTHADDYITKPFTFSELDHRIEALLRRSSQRFLQLGDLSIDTELALVTLKNDEVFLSVQEYRILLLLMGRAEEPVSRTILNSALNILETTQEGTLNVAITRLRKKLGTSVNIESVFKQGYRICL